MLQRISILLLLNLFFTSIVYAQDAAPNYLELGITQNKTGNYADALRNFSIEIEKNIANPNPISFYNRGFAKYNLKDFRGSYFRFWQSDRIETHLFRSIYRERTKL